MSNLFSQLSGFNSNQIKQLANFDYDEKCDRDYSLGNGDLADVDVEKYDFEDSITLFANNYENKDVIDFSDENDEYGGFDLEG